MAPDSEAKFESYLGKLDQQEKSQRGRLALWTLVPAALGLLLLAYSVREVSTAEKKAAAIEDSTRTMRVEYHEMQARYEPLHQEFQDLQMSYAELDQRFIAETQRLEAALTETRTQLANVEDQLHMSTDLNRFRFDVDMKTVKVLASRYPRQSVLLEQIFYLRDQDVRWRLGGQSPDQGFDSPSFAAFVLREHDLFTGTGEEVYRLSRHFERVEEPRVGDLVIYPSGYSLFYFEDEHRSPFVMGMTPFGVLSLKPNFEHVVGYYRIPYGH